ncbi:hypothetical protein ACVR1G_02525 [Streptococcus dentasini]
MVDKFFSELYEICVRKLIDNDWLDRAVIFLVILCFRFNPKLLGNFQLKHVLAGNYYLTPIGNLIEFINKYYINLAFYLVLPYIASLSVYSVLVCVYGLLEKISLKRNRSLRLNDYLDFMFDSKLLRRLTIGSLRLLFYSVKYLWAKWFPLFLCVMLLYYDNDFWTNITASHINSLDPMFAGNSFGIFVYRSLWYSDKLTFNVVFDIELLSHTMYLGYRLFNLPPWFSDVFSGSIKYIERKISPEEPKK